MSRAPLIITIIVFATVILACGFTINLPIHEISTGPTQTDKIEVAKPDVSLVDLTLAFGAGDLEINPGAEKVLVYGTATYNLDLFKPNVTVNEGKVRIETGDLELHGIPNFTGSIKNKWDLELGNTPMNLVINAGAYQGEMDLGGLSLKTLEVNDGASTVQLEFSDANRVDMDSLRYTTGASTVKLIGLSNANFTSMIFRSGAGEYTLDFSGDLKRDAVVTVESGMSQVVIIVPEGIDAKLLFSGGFTDVDYSDGWEKSGIQYLLKGTGPTLTINVDMGAGDLELRTTPHP